MTAAATLAGLLGIDPEDVHIGSEPRSENEAWVRLTVTDATANPGTDREADQAAEPADAAGNPTGAAPDTPIGAAPATPDEETSHQDEPGEPGTGGTEFVFTATFAVPTRILAVTCCPSCGRPVATTAIEQLADLDTLITGGTVPASDPARAPGSEIHAHSTHAPGCPHAAPTTA